MADKKNKKSKKTTDEFIDESGVITINENESPDARWYVVHTYSGHEKKVAVTLKQRVEARGFVNKIYKILIPQQKKIVISEGKKREVDERLFPGYIMVNMIMGDDAWHIVRSTKGVTGFVSTGTTPTPLPDSEAKKLLKYIKMEAPKFEAKFSVGDTIRVIDGPFKDFLGKVDEVNEEQGKVVVLISVFGSENPVELDFLQVQSI